MSILNNPLAVELFFSDSAMSVVLKDGRTISVPLTWFPILSHATADQLQDYIIMGDGEGIHWPQLDEDICVVGLLLGLGSVDVA